MSDITELALQLRDPSPAVRSDAVEALAKTGDSRVVAPLITALQDESESVRGCVLHALDKFGETAAALISALVDPVAFVCRHTIAALEKTGSKRAIPQLEKMTKDEPEESVRQAAKRTLRKRRN